MSLVGGHRVPNQKLTILRGRNQAPVALSPVHGVDLSQVTLQDTAVAKRGVLREVAFLTSDEILELYRV